MPLLSLRLLVLLGFLAAASPAAAVLLWRRVRGPRAVRGLGRVGLVAVAQLTAVAFVAAAANDYGLFYASWSDLFASPDTASTLRPVAGGDPSAASYAHLIRRPVRWAGVGAARNRGRIVEVTLAGPRSGATENAYVYLPPQYFRPRYRHTRFHGVEVVPGYPGSGYELIHRLRYPQALLADVRAGTSPPLVLVMLDITVAPPRDTECTDVPYGPQALTYLSQDVPAAVSARFRVLPTGWGVVGHSTGGFCATKVAMAQSTTFSAAASLYGYYHAVTDVTTGDLFGGSPYLRGLNDPEWRLRHLPPPPVSLLVVTGGQAPGPLGQGDAAAFLRLVRAPLRASELYNPRGGHNLATWEGDLPRVMSWLGRQLVSARPPRPARVVVAAGARH